MLYSSEIQILTTTLFDGQLITCICSLSLISRLLPRYGHCGGASFYFNGWFYLRIQRGNFLTDNVQNFSWL